jgi:hypothetical protein
MSADTLTADGSAAVLPGPSPDSVPAGHYAESGYVVLPGQDEVVVLSLGTTYESTAVLDGYTLGGASVFQTVPVSYYGSHGSALFSASVFGVGSGGAFGLAYNKTYYGGTGSAYSVFTSDGRFVQGALIDPNYQTGPAAGSDTPTGFHLEWVTEGFAPAYDRPPYVGSWADYSSGSSSATVRTDAATTMPYAATAVGGATLAVRDNQVTIGGAAVATLPGEGSASVSGVAATGLADGSTAAVAWVDSGTDYVSLFNTATNSFGPVIGLDWGGVSDLHLLALPDGGFAASWLIGGAYRGEVFDAAGNGGGVLSLAGDVAGIDSHGDLYTVGLNSSGQYVVQTYAINGAGNGSVVGQTFTSDNNGDHWTGTSGDDTFHLGRGGDVVTGNGGNDAYDFAEVPWAGGHITDFNAGDVLDLTGAISTTSETAGGDAFADGFAQITDDGAGNAQVWIRYNAHGLDAYGHGWWLVETLDGVAPGSLQTSGDVVTVASTQQTDVSTADPNYVAPSYVTSITLTGSQQHIDASATHGVTITSNNTGNVLIGGAGDDTFHLGRGGDSATGGAGADTFAYAETPWAAGHITDFNGSDGDVIDVRGMLQASGYAGSDPFTDGYLRITDSASGAQIWSDVNQPGNTDWWLVGTIDGVSTSSLHYSGGLIT